MSNIYSKIPKTKGKIIIEFTTYGNVEISLFPQQIPKTIKFLIPNIENWLRGQVVSEIVLGKYISIPLNMNKMNENQQLINEFEELKKLGIENHSRLKFTSRGFVSLDLFNQTFHITLGAIPEWNFKKTIIGFIEGNTIFNVTRLAESMHEFVNPETIQSPNSLSPIIKNIFIDVNPFEEIQSMASIPSSLNEINQLGQNIELNHVNNTQKFKLNEQNSTKNIIQSNLSNTSLLSFSSFIENSMQSRENLSINNIQIKARELKPNRKRKRDITSDNSFISKKTKNINDNNLEHELDSSINFNKINDDIKQSDLNLDIDDELELQQKMIEKMNKDRELLLSKRKNTEETKNLQKNTNSLDSKLNRFISKTLSKSNSDTQPNQTNSNITSNKNDLSFKKRKLSGKEYLEEQRNKYMKKGSKYSIDENESKVQDPLNLLKKGISTKWKQSIQVAHENTSQIQNEQNNFEKFNQTIDKLKKMETKKDQNYEDNDSDYESEDEYLVIDSKSNIN